MKLRFTIPLMVSLALLVGCSGKAEPKLFTSETDQYAYVKAYMRWYIKDMMEEENLVGVSVALVDDQKVVWQEGFGYADKEKEIKATPQTRYRAGSITKLLNAMAVMKLVEEGKLELDKPLKSYLPEFSVKSRFGSTEGITPRTLMSHHSGIMGDWYNRDYDTNTYDYSDYVNLVKDAYVPYAPNTIFSYSNLGITLLGNAVEKRANQKYVAFIDEQFFKPMKMKNSTIEEGFEGKSYREGKKHKDYPSGMIPAGGLNTSVSDLSHLAMMINADGKFNGKTVLKPSSLKEMQKAQNKNVALDFGDKIGLGLFISDKIMGGQERIYHHGGDIGTHHSFFALTKNSKLGVIVMSNSNETSSWSIAYEMMKKAYEAKTGKKLPKKRTLNRLTKASTLDGTYATSLGKITFKKKDKGVYTTELMGKTIRLKRGEDNRYHAKYLLLGLIPLGVDELDSIALLTTEIEGKTYLINEDSWSKSVMGVKVERKPISKVWKERLGAYALVNQLKPKEMQIKRVIAKIEDGYPLLTVEMRSGETLSYILDLVNDREAIMDGIGRSMRETIRVVDGEFRYSGLRFRRVEKR